MSAFAMEFHVMECFTQKNDLFESFSSVWLDIEFGDMVILQGV